MNKRAARFTALLIALLVYQSVGTAGHITGAAATTTNKVAANYKNVVFIPSFASFQLGTECYSNNLGTRELANLKNGPANMHYKYIWQENYPVNSTAAQKAEFDADMKVAPRYFRVNLSKAQKIGSSAPANWRTAIARGDAPGFIWAESPIPTSNTALPTTTTKIYIRSWVEEFRYSTKYSKSDYANQAVYYTNRLFKDYDRVANARPKAKLYVGSMELVSWSYPRVDDPRLTTESMLRTWGGLIGYLEDGARFTYDVDCRKEINRLIASYCKKKGYVFIDFTKSGLTDSDGYLLEKYVHMNGIGFQMNQAGLTIEGDYICKAMGLPTAKVMYKLK